MINDFCFPRLIKNNRLDIGSLNLLNLPNLATRLTRNPWAAKKRWWSDNTDKHMLEFSDAHCEIQLELKYHAACMCSFMRPWDLAASKSARKPSLWRTVINPNLILWLYCLQSWLLNKCMYACTYSMYIWCTYLPMCYNIILWYCHIVCPKMWYDHGSMSTKHILVWFWYGVLQLVVWFYIDLILKINELYLVLRLVLCLLALIHLILLALVINNSSFSWDLETFNLIITKSSVVLKSINTSLIKHKLVLAAAATDFAHYHA